MLPTNLEEIGAYSFAGCKSLRRVILPPNVKRIRDHAFENCEALEYIALPASIDTIEYHAFSGAAQKEEDLWHFSKLHNLRVDCYALTPPVIGWYGTFDNEDYKFDLYVPAESVEKYKASYWAREFNIYALDPEDNPYTAIREVEDGKLKVSVRGGVVSVEGVDEFDVYDMSGRKMPASRPLPAGVYVVTASTGSVRVVVK